MTTTLAVSRFRTQKTTRDKSFDNRDRLLPLLIKGLTNLRLFLALTAKINMVNQLVF